MAKTLTLLVLGSALGLPASASQPGQPLDCSDWISDSPGYTCEEVDAGYQTRGTDLAIDSQGFRLYVSGYGSFGLVRQDPVTGEQQSVGHIVNRDGPNNTADEIHGTPGCPRNSFGIFICDVSLQQTNVVWFDPVNGTLSIPVISHCSSNGSNCNPALYYGDYHHMLRIRGFATLLEIYQSYIPQTATIRFTVPVMPEGLTATDHFDTYYGALTNPIDFTTAQPLQCGYPASPPSVGDYLTVTDPLPNPAPGSGRYYVTAVSYQGQRRYGRQRVGGVLSGRDPESLSVCSEGTIP